MDSAKLILGNEEYEFPVVQGSEEEVGIDMTSLRGKTKAVSFDPGYGNTGACESGITFIDGEKGILRYRGLFDRGTSRTSQLCGGMLSATAW